MKKILLGSFLALGMVASLNAAETSSSEVKATINKECIGIVIDSNMNFGSDINPFADYNQNTGWGSWAPDGSLVNGFIAYHQCTKSTSVSTTFASANNWKVVSQDGTELDYDFYWKDGRTFIAKGTPYQWKYGAYLPVNNLTKPGHYTDTITTTFTW